MPALATVLRLALACLALNLTVRADVVLPSILSNGMVLQRETPAPVWGWADPGEEVTVEFAGQTKKVMPDRDGKWMVKLDALEASAEPRNMTISGKNKIRLENVLVGEVWIASGQSNMEWTFNQIDPTERAFAESQKDNPLVRAFHVYRHLSAGIPMDDAPGVWKNAAQMVTGPGSVSAVGFFFAVDLAQELQVPVAILDVNWGGTPIERFLAPEGYWATGLPFAEPDRRVKRSAAAAAGQIAGARASIEESFQAAQKGLKMAFDAQNPYGQSENFIYNAMVAPMVPYAVRGAIWYQGESNRGSKDYFRKLQALSAGWSQVFRVKDMPLLLVQIAPFDYTRGQNPAESLLADNIWAAQYEAAAKIPGVEVIPIHDTGIDIKDIHPVYKRTVGERLAASALKNQYGKEGRPASAPRFQSARSEGSKVVVSFDGVLNALATGNGQAPSCFELSADGRTFVPAQAVIQGDTVVVANESLPEPKFVRMGWSDTAIPNLRDRNGWPVFAFPSQQVEAPPAAPVDKTKPAP